MNNLKPLIYCLNIEQSGGANSESTESTEFIPYSDHYKMPEEQRIAKPMFCPDIAPFKCSSKSKRPGTCQISKYNCSKNLDDQPQKYPIKYIPKSK